VPQELAAGQQDQFEKQPQGEPVHHYHSHNAFSGSNAFVRFITCLLPAHRAAKMKIKRAVLAVETADTQLHTLLPSPVLSVGKGGRFLYLSTKLFQI